MAEELREPLDQGSDVTSGLVASGATEEYPFDSSDSDEDGDIAALAPAPAPAPAAPAPPLWETRTFPELVLALHPSELHPVSLAELSAQVPV